MHSMLEFVQYLYIYVGGKRGWKSLIRQAWLRPYKAPGIVFFDIFWHFLTDRKSNWPTDIKNLDVEAPSPELKNGQKLSPASYEAFDRQTVQVFFTWKHLSFVLFRGDGIPRKLPQFLFSKYKLSKDAPENTHRIQYCCNLLSLNIKSQTKVKETCAEGHHLQIKPPNSGRDLPANHINKIKQKST